jgi:hypothetical protein
LFSLETVPKDICEREEQAEGEGQEDEEHNGEMQRDYSPSCAKASKTEAESGKEIQPKGKTCPFFRHLKEEDGLKRTQKGGEDTHEHENNETRASEMRRAIARRRGRGGQANGCRQRVALPIGQRIGSV